MSPSPHQLDSQPTPLPASRNVWLLGAALAVAGVVIWLAIWWWQDRQQARWLQELPTAQRQALYQRSLENLRTVCRAAPTDRLSEFCREQAEIVTQLPECDQPCRELARIHLPQPTR